MPYDKNNIHNTTEDGINDLVNDIVSVPLSINFVFKEIKFRPLQKKIKKALEDRDNIDWERFSQNGSFEEYLSLYDRESPFYRGIHVEDAKITLESSDSNTSIEDGVSETDSLNNGKTPCVNGDSNESNPIIIDEELESESTLDSGEVSNPFNEGHVNINEETSNLEDSGNETNNNENDIIEEVFPINDSDASCPDSWNETNNNENVIIEEVLPINDSDASCSDSWNETNNNENVIIEEVFPINDSDTSCPVNDPENGDINEEQNIDNIISDTTDSNVTENKNRSDDKVNSIKQKIFKKIILLVLSCLALSGVALIMWNLFRPSDPFPLSQDEIDSIITQYQDSLKRELFDGFYMVPMLQSDKQYCDSNGNIFKPQRPYIDCFSKEDVIQKYIAGTGYVLKNKSNETLTLPETWDGIDSVCVSDSPFFEYIDNNGLRRVVALYNDQLYYYLGECGTVDNIPQFILVNQDGKYGILNINKKENKHFENEKIAQLSSSKRYYVLNNGVKTEYENGHEYIPTQTSQPIVTSPSNSSSSSSNYLIYYYDWDKHAYGYKNSQGNIVIKPQYVNAYSFTGDYAKVKGPNGYGVINKSNVICIPLKYEYLYLSGSYAKVKDSNGLYGLISVTGKRILNDIYDNIGNINQGLVPCKLKGYWGYMTTSGSKAIDFKFNDAGGFSSFGLAVVKDPTTNLSGYINKSGDYVIRPSFYSAGTIDENGAQIGNSDGLKARIDKNGNILTQYYKEIGTNFYCDRIWVVKDSLIGFSDSQKHLIIPFIFDYSKDKQPKPSFDSYSHLCKVFYNGVEWYINTNGAFAYPANENPTEQNITLQVKAAKAEAERKAREDEQKDIEKLQRKERQRNNQSKPSRSEH